MKIITTNIISATHKREVDIGELVGIHTATAHPHTGRDGTTYNMGTAMSRQCRYCIVQIPATNPGEDPWQKASILGSVPSSCYSPSYYHSFGITENYVVFLEQPLRLSVLKIATAKLRNRPLSSCMVYDPESPARFHLIRRSDGASVPTQYTADAFFCFHHINAYESDDGRHLAVDMCCFEDDDVITRANWENVQRGKLSVEDSQVRRYVLPLDDGTLSDQAKISGGRLVSMAGSEATSTMNEDGSIHCTHELLCDESLELPQINYAEYNGRDYRYIYGMGGDAQRLHKIDLKTRQVLTWSSPGYFPAEPVFVSAPTKAAEDDGVILSCVVNLEDDSKPPFLLVLDARTFTEIARAEVPYPITTFGFHGMFVHRE